MRGSVLLFGAAAMLLCAIPALATTHLVENSKNSGTGSLRDAIVQANGDASATAADPDTILLTQAVTADIAPSALLPDLAGFITLVGTESLTVQIKGAKTFRAFTIDAGATVRMVNLRVTSGTTTDVGAGILNAGDLTMVNCNLRNHTTGSLGGAVQNTGRLTLIRCWLDKNKVKSGGGLATGGGAINNDEPGVVVATNCTFSNNVCSKGGYGGTIRSASSGGVWLDHCTIAFGDSREPTPGGGGIATVGAGVTHVDNSIIVGSVTGGDVFGPLQSDRGHDVFGSTDLGAITGSTDGDIVGVDAASVIEPTLEHSGVFGRTHALIPGSPALDAAVMDPARDPATDGRDMPRGVNGASDIGAFEEQQPLAANMVTNGSFEGSVSGWSAADQGAARLTLVPGGMAGTSAAHVAQDKAEHVAFGLGARHPLLKSTTAGQRYRFSAFVRSDASQGQAWLRLREVHGEHSTQTVSSPAVGLTPEWQLVTAELTARRSGSSVEFEVLDTPLLPAEAFDVDLVSMRPVLGPDTPPRVLAPPAADAYVGLPLTIGVNALDADGDTLALIAADASALPSPSTFTSGPANHTGQFLWTPVADDTTDSPYPVVFSAENVRTGHVVTTIRVLPAPPNLVANPDFELGTSGWGPFAGSALSQSADAHSGTSALLVTGSPKSSATFGCTDVPDAVAQASGAGSRYRFLAWVKGGSGSGTAKLRVREFLGKRQVAPSGYSLEVPLSASWQLLSVDYVASRPGSSLDLRVTEQPAARGASFLVDDVTIIAAGNVLEAPALLAADDGAGDAPATSDAPALRIVPTTAADEEPGYRTVAVEGLDRELEAGPPAAVLHLGAQQVLAAAERTRTGLDLDGNGIEEVVFAFPDAALASASSAEIEIAPGTSHAIRLALDPVAGTPVAEFRAWVPRNPILAQGTLEFTTTHPEPVRVQLFDTSGRRVQTLEDEANAAAGRHTLAIGGRDAALRSGVYFYRIATGEGVLDGHFALIR